MERGADLSGYGELIWNGSGIREKGYIWSARV